MSANPFVVKKMAAALAAAGFMVIGALGGSQYLASAAPASTQAILAVVHPGALMPVQGTADFANIVEAYRDSVVNIRTSAMERTAASPAPEAGRDGDPLQEFFRRFQIPQPNGPRQGMGSGFIVSTDGIILTNAHVVQGASEVTVKLSDRREYKAKVLGSDAQSDIAAIKINAERLTPVKLGDSKLIRVGEWVLASARLTGSRTP